LSDTSNQPTKQELLDQLDASRRIIEEIPEEESESISGGGMIKSALQLLKTGFSSGKNTFPKVGSDFMRGNW
jgi:hypothetical protein